MSAHRGIAAALAVALASLAEMGCERRDQEVITAPAPLKDVTFKAYTQPLTGEWYQEVWITLLDKETLATVVDLRVFGGFSPGTTADEATRHGGQASDVRTDAFGTWHRYANPLANVEIGCERSRSGDSGSGESCEWRLYASPVSTDPATIYNKAILDQLEAARSRKRRGESLFLLIRGPDGTALVDSSIKHGRVTRMQLYARAAPAATR